MREAVSDFHMLDILVANTFKHDYMEWIMHCRKKIAYFGG